MDLYAALGAGRGADRGELRVAYREAVRRWHPDRDASPEAAARFLAAQRAWEVLGDPARRARYDAEQDAARGVGDVVFTAGSLAADLRRLARRAARRIAAQVAERRRRPSRDLE